MSIVAGIDVGGTRIKGAVFDDGVLLRHARVPTPRDDPSGALVADSVAELSRELGPDVRAVGLVAPGVVDAERGVVVHSRNLQWDSVPLRELVASRLEAPVRFGHDVRLGGLAEHAMLPTEHRADKSMFVPVGTGISVAITRNGVPESHGGWAGEIGGMRVSVDPTTTLESVASAAGIARHSGQPDGESAFRLAMRGEPAAAKAWEHAVLALAEALAWGVALHAPQHVIIGGGLSRVGSALLDPLRTALSERLGDLPRPTMRAAVLGDLSGCHGAAMMARGDAS